MPAFHYLHTVDETPTSSGCQIYPQGHTFVAGDDLLKTDAVPTQTAIEFRDSVYFKRCETMPASSLVRGELYTRDELVAAFVEGFAKAAVASNPQELLEEFIQRAVTGNLVKNVVDTTGNPQ